MKETVLDLSNYQVKATLLTHVRALEGPHRVTIVKHRKMRTNAQNAYYHGVIVEIFADFLRESGWELDDEGLHEYAHEKLRSMFGLRREVTNSVTGETETTILSTSKYSTVEFIDYNERCAQWLSESWGLIIPAPNPYYNVEAPTVHNPN